MGIHVNVEVGQPSLLPPRIKFLVPCCQATMDISGCTEPEAEQVVGTGYRSYSGRYPWSIRRQIHIHLSRSRSVRPLPFPYPFLHSSFFLASNQTIPYITTKDLEKQSCGMSRADHDILCLGDHNICLHSNITGGWLSTQHIKLYLDINVGSSKHDVE